MKNLHDVLRTKEQEILRLKKEIDALKIAARIMTEAEATPSSTVPEARIEVRHLLQMP
jgi:hypothetical protein